MSASHAVSEAVQGCLIKAELGMNLIRLVIPTAAAATEECIVLLLVVGIVIGTADQE